MNYMEYFKLKPTRIKDNMTEYLINKNLLEDIFATVFKEEADALVIPQKDFYLHRDCETGSLFCEVDEDVIDEEVDERICEKIYTTQEYYVLVDVILQKIFGKCTYGAYFYGNHRVKVYVPI